MSVVAPFEPRRHRLDVEDLMRMVAAGIVAEDARVELIEGELDRHGTDQCRRIPGR